jgi:8-oxo-dGTP pyrophosphatase MutT (NUDIX family)
MTIIKQAAAIPYRFIKNELHILLIKSRNSKKWIVPKGVIEEGDSARFTAEKETEEEAGVKGELKKEIAGTYDYKKWGSICRVRVFPMKVTDVMEEWEEMHFRPRKWKKADEAVKAVKSDQLKKILKQFIKSNNK